MNWIETPELSNIARFKYDNQNMVLTVEFRNGGRYEYFDVPEVIFDGMKIGHLEGAISCAKYQRPF